AGQRPVLERHRPRHVVDAEHRQALAGSPGGEGLDVVVVVDVQVAVGDHRAAPVPAPPPDHVHTGDVERVGGAHDRPDVEVAAPVLDRDVQRVAPGVEVGDD